MRLKLKATLKCSADKLDPHTLKYILIFTKYSLPAIL